MYFLKKFDIKPKNEVLYKKALTHSSYSIKHDLSYDYERLEFLGDTILNMFVSDFIYELFPNLSEGDLSKLRSNYICRTALIHYSQEVGLDKHIKFNIDDNLSDSEILSIVADVFESTIAAIFLDQGIYKAKNFISTIVFKYIENLTVFFYDYKSKLKEIADKNNIKLEYVVLKEVGTPHRKTFSMAVMMDGKQIGVGAGRNKKKAQQNASKNVLKKYDIEVHLI